MISSKLGGLAIGRTPRRIVFFGLLSRTLRNATAALALLILLCQPLQAAPTTSLHAAAAVRGWLKADPIPLGEPLPPEILRIDAIKDTSGSNLCFAVYLKPSGFVIVAPDDQVEPVIAFSPRGQFDPSPKNPLGALVSRDLPQRLAHARKPGLAAVDKVLIASKNKWQQLQQASLPGAVPHISGFMPSDVRIAPLIQSQWDQKNVSGHAVFNYYTPPNSPGDVNNYYCGCTATAQAQVMRYHQYPKDAIGTASCSFWVNSVRTSANLRGGDGLGGPYDWANMPLKPNNPTVTQCQAIGALLYDVGISCEMQYSPTGSAASTESSQLSLLNTYHYANASYAWLFDSTENAPVQMVNPNLDARLPVIFGIAGDIYAHEVVCDGYGYSASSLYHHINMGWGGDSDAWYSLPWITEDFYAIEACIYNVFPTGTGEIISGRIVDGHGTPLSGVLVTTSGFSTATATTDANGIYALTRLPSYSSFELTATKAGYASVSSTYSTGSSINQSTSSGNIWGADFTLTPPNFTITQQPISQQVKTGGNVTFTVATSATEPLSYQWQLNGNNISGATQASYTITGVGSKDAGDYCVIITSSNTTQTSRAATLTVLAPPAIAIPPWNQFVVLGATANFAVVATGSEPLFYQWQFNETNIQDATANALWIRSVAATNAGSYRVIVSNMCGMVTSTVAALSLAKPPTINQQPADRTIIAGQPASFTVGANGSPTLAYQWRFNGLDLSKELAATLTIPNPTADNAGNYSVVVRNNYGAVTSSIAALVILTPPIVMLQPLNQTIGAGSNATFATSARGDAPLSFQWQRNGANILGATSASYGINGVSPTQAGQYAVVVANYVGATTSIVANLVVLIPPSITTQPRCLTNVAGSAATFNVTVSGSTPLICQWLRNGAIIPGATSLSYTIPSVQASDEVNFSVIITNAAGSATSSVATLTVPAPPLILSHPTNVTVWSGTNATFSVIANGAVPLSYQWQFNNVNILGATSPTLTTMPTASGYYRVIVTNLAGSATSRMARLILAVPPSITSQPQSKTNIAASAVDFTVSTTGTSPMTYKWFFNGTSIDGATASTYTIPAVTSSNAGAYSVIVTNNYGMATSSVAVLTVWTPPSIVTQPISQALGAGTNVAFNFNATGDAPLSYQWRLNGTNLSAGTSTNYTIAGASALDAGVYTVVVTNNYGSQTSSLASLTVWFPPAIVTQPHSQTNILGTPAGFATAATGSAPLAYQWLQNQTNLIGATSTNYLIPSVSATNSGGYTVVVTNMAGSATSTLATLTVLTPPIFIVQPADKAVAVGSKAVLTVQTTGATPMSYQWQKNGVKLANSSRISGATSNVLSITGIAMSDTASYGVVVSNFLGTTISSNALLTAYIPDTGKPTLTISSPTSGLRLSSNLNLFIASGTARDNVAVSNVLFQLNTNSWALAATANRWSNWTAAVSLKPGTNSLRAFAIDPTGNRSLTTCVSLVYVPLAKLVVSTNYTGSVSPQTNGQWLVIGSNYTVTAKPTPGWAFSNWTGTVTGNSNPLVFTMQSNTVLQPVFGRNPFQKIAGVYQGLFRNGSNAASVATSGGFIATLSDSGSFTAGCSITNHLWPFSGQFSLTGVFSNTVSFGKSNVTAVLQLDLTGGDKITGFISNSAWKAPLLAYRSAFSSNNPAPQAGRYTLVIPGSDAAALQPGGDSYGSLTVDASGKVIFTGALADGAEAVVSQSSIVSKDGLSPFFISLYSGAGSISGWLGFTNEADNDLNGYLTWIKPSGVKAGAYPSGFTNVTEAAGSRYTNGSPILKLASGTIKVTHGNLPQSLANRFTLGAGNTITSTNKTLTLSFTPISGLFQGTMANPFATAKTISFKGVVLQKQTNAYGYFIGTNQSGQVTLTPQ